jgi:hypothetical protein
MPVPLPNLDDRRWADLVEEGRALIPLYAPDWTDHNVSDPGITLMELLAWIAEMDLYWLNRVPDSHRREFLGLVGIQPEPPRPARTVLSLDLGPRPSPGDVLSLPAGVQFEGQDPFGERTLFRTLRAAMLAPGRLKAIQVSDGSDLRDVTERWRRGEPVALFGEDPQPGTELYLGFSQALPVDVPINLFFTFSDSRSGREERDRLLAEIKSRLEACREPGVLDKKCQPKGQPPASAEGDVAAEEETRLAHHSVQTAWELHTSGNRWQRLEPAANQVVDDTRSFSLDGQVLIRAPAEMSPKQLGQVEADLYYLRCRFLAGAYDAAPAATGLALNGVPAEQAAPVAQSSWTIARDAAINGTPPTPGHRARFRLAFNDQGEISTLTFVDDENDVPDFLVLAYDKPPTKAGHLSIEAEDLGLGRGAPGQQLTLSEPAVQVSSLLLFTLEGDTWRWWALRPDLHASGRDDAHFLLDPTRGLISFGDGEQGRVVPRGAPILASYRTTRGEAGNLDAGRITLLADTRHNQAVLEDFAAAKQRLVVITNRLAATGGAPAETIDQAGARAFDWVERSDRAVTLADCEELAMRTPGVRVARAYARANMHPGFPCVNAPGMIMVVVLSCLPLEKPMASDGLRWAVANYLARRRIIGTRVEVVGPSYLEVAVRAQVRACAGVNAVKLQEQIVEALDSFFHPLDGGPDATGWPFGRDIYRSEVLQVIDEVEGTDHVLSLDLIVEGGEPQCGNVCLGPTSLVDAGQHQIEIV